MNENNKRLISPSKSDFLYCLRQLLPGFVAVFLFCFFTVPVASFSKDFGVPVFLYDYGTDFKAIISTVIPYGVYSALFLLVGIACGFIHFGFLRDENAVFSQLSFCEKRERIIKNRIFSFVTELLISLLLPLSVSFIINCVTLGVTKELVLTFISFFLPLAVTSLWGYFCSWTACSQTTGKVRSVIYGLCFTYFPMIFTDILLAVCKTFLYGWSGDTVLSGYDNPLIFNLLSPNTGLSFGSFMLSVFENPSFSLCGFESFSEKTSYSVILSAVLWLVIISVSIIICKKRFIKNKPENISSDNMSVPGVTVSALCISMILTDLFFVVASFSEDDNLWKTAILTMSFVFLLTLVLIDIKNIKPKKIIYSIASFVCLIGVLSLVVLTHGFGYEKRMPDINDIKKIEVSADGMLMLSPYDNYSETFTSEKDKKFITQLHKNLTESNRSKTNIWLNIEYTLKNGEKFARNYSGVSDKITEELLELTKTDAYKKELSDNLGASSEKNSQNENSSETIETVTYKDYNMIFVSKDNTQRVVSENEITKDRFNKIKEALYKDITGITSLEYFDGGEELGKIIFCDKSYNKPSSDFDEFNEFYDFGYTYFINDNMKNTVSLLKEYGLYKYLEERG